MRVSTIYAEMVEVQEVAPYNAAGSGKDALGTTKKLL